MKKFSLILALSWKSFPLSKIILKDRFDFGNEAKSFDVLKCMHRIMKSVHDNGCKAAAFWQFKKIKLTFKNIFLLRVDNLPGGIRFSTFLFINYCFNVNLLIPYMIYFICMIFTYNSLPNGIQITTK